MTTIDEFASGFLEEPGYLDYAHFGPLSASVNAEIAANAETLSRARFGTIERLDAEDERMRRAVSTVTGFPAEQVVYRPNTSIALMQTMFGLTGEVLLSPAEHPSVTFAAVRAAESMHAVAPIWLETDHGRVLPGQIREQITATTAAVAVSLVDARTGYVVDIEGIRQVIGDRLLIVDATLGLGVVDAPYAVADVVASGGQTWLRAGWGTGFLALSARAIERLTPVISGYPGIGEESAWDQVPPAAADVSAFQVTRPDRVAEARLAAALEDVAAVGVARIEAAVAERSGQLIDLADEFAIPISSSRIETERAGIVVLQPDAERLTLLAAALFNHGVSATTAAASIRLSAHVATDAETIQMLRQAFVSFATAR